MRLRHVALAAIVVLALAPGAARANEAENSQALRSAAARSFTPPTFEYQPLATQEQPVDYWQQVGINAVIANDYPNALAALNKATDLATSSEPKILEQRGWVHYRLGNEQMAFADLKLAATLYLTNENSDAHANTQSMLRYIDNQSDTANSPG